MGLLDRIFGTSPARDAQSRSTGGREPDTIPGMDRRPMPSVDDAVAAEDERALARYRYLLRTAPPQ